MSTQNTCGNCGNDGVHTRRMRAPLCDVCFGDWQGLPDGVSVSSDHHDPKVQAVIDEYNLLVRKMASADKAQAEWRFEYFVHAERERSETRRHGVFAVKTERPLSLAALECAASAARRAVEKAKEDVMRAVAEMAKENER